MKHNLFLFALVVLMLSGCLSVGLIESQHAEKIHYVITTVKAIYESNPAPTLEPAYLVKAFAWLYWIGAGVWGICQIFSVLRYFLKRDQLMILILKIRIIYRSIVASSSEVTDVPQTMVWLYRLALVLWCFRQVFLFLGSFSDQL